MSSNRNVGKLVVCSVMVKPVRELMKDTIRTWFDQIVRVPVHTFLVEESKIPLNPNSIDGYWYCAGDFCNIDEAGVYQFIDTADISYARCLVAPNIKDSDPNRPKLVIEGTYGVNYVCHNITNRVLYATKTKSTLGTIGIPNTGYAAVVKSALGVYGQNQVEWERRKKRCSPGESNENHSYASSPNAGESEVRNREVSNIHLVASGGDTVKAANVTHALRDVDSLYLHSTIEANSRFTEGSISLEAYNQEMVNACAKLFSQTKQTIGVAMTERIYPGCNLEIESHEIDATAETEERYMTAGG